MITVIGGGENTRPAMPVRPCHEFHQPPIWHPAYPLSSVPPVRIPKKGQLPSALPYVLSHEGRHRWQRIVKALVLVTEAEGSITPLWLMVALAIYDRARTNEGCWASYETLAADVRKGVPGTQRVPMRCKVKSVERAVAALVKMGLLYTLKHYSISDGVLVGATNTIWLTNPTDHGGLIGTRDVRDGGHRAPRKGSKTANRPADRLKENLDSILTVTNQKGAEKAQEVAMKVLFTGAAAAPNLLEMRRKTFEQRQLEARQRR